MTERRSFKARSSASPDHPSAGPQRFPFLVLRGDVWAAKMLVPLPLRTKLGRSVFTRSTREDDAAKAWAKAEPWIKEWKEQIAAAKRSGGGANVEWYSSIVRTGGAGAGPGLAGHLGQQELALKVERKPFQSPRGTAHWPSLHRTESYKGKDTGNYTLKLILEGAALEQVKAEVEEFLVDTYGPKKAKQAKSPFKLTKPKEGSGDSPKTFITFRMKATGKDGDPRTVALFDAKGNLVERKVNLGGGSVVRINGIMQAFSDDPGVAFYMDSVQIIKLVEPPPLFEPVDDPDGFVGLVQGAQRG